MADNFDKRIPRKLRDFLRSVMESFEIEESVGSITYAVNCPTPETDGWHVALYMAPMEVYRGKDDGARVLPSLKVDLRHISRLFDPVARGNGWEKSVTFEHAAGKNPDPKIVFCGKFKGELITLEILAIPPKGAEHSYLVDGMTGKILERGE